MGWFLNCCKHTGQPAQGVQTDVQVKGNLKGISISGTLEDHERMGCCLVAGAPILPPPQPKLRAPHSQHIVPEATLPLSLVEEVIEVAAEGDEDKAKSQEAKNACGIQGQDRLPEQTL